MDFEFDAIKSRAHQLKHGIDFNKAQALWDDYNYIELPARTQGEPRWLVIGRISGVHYSVVITYRGDRIRLISVRRARREEVEVYEE